MGLGLPSGIELSRYPQGTANAAGSWSVHAVSDRLTNLLAVPVYVEHDVNILAFGEYRARWSKAETLICLKVGFERAVLGDGAGIYGAAMMVAENALTPTAVQSYLLARLA